MHREIELKFRLDEAAHDRLRGQLVALGAAREGLFLEENLYCDDDAASLKSVGRALRLRSSSLLESPISAVKYRVTFKEPVSDGEFKVRSEVEVTVDDLDSCRLIFERLGYAVRFKYEKQREIWRLGGVLVTLDALTIGRFAELEGSPEDIRVVARRLGLDIGKGITKSYLTLLAEENRSGHSHA